MRHGFDSGTDAQCWSRVTEDNQVAELVYARRSERRARMGMRVQLSPWLLDFIAGATDVQPARAPTESWSAAGALGSIPRPATCGWASAHSGLISLNGRVRLPDPLLDKAEHANWQSGHRPIRLRRIVARSIGDFAGSNAREYARQNVKRDYQKDQHNDYRDSTSV